MKYTYASGYVHDFLHGAYSLKAIFVGSFIFISGFDILLFLFIDATTRLDVTRKGKADARCCWLCPSSCTAWRWG